MRLLDVDPLTRIRRQFRYDNTDETFVVQTTQDVEPTIELTKAFYNATDERAPWKGDLHKVASIPLVVWADLVRKGIAYDDAALRRWLDDSEQRVFRVRPGKLSK